MKVWALFYALALSVVAMPQVASADDTVGVRQIAAPSKERGVDLDVTVWYPAQPGGQAVLLGDSALFVGTPARRDAPIAAGKVPLILLSHGAGLAGSAQALSWLAAPLAARGFIVVAPTHPGNSGKTRSAAETMKMWLRPADLTEALNAMELDGFFKDHLDRGRIGVLGLSMGGSTALALAGARMDPKRLATYCDTDALNPSLCGWVRQSGVDLHAMDLAPAARDNADKRIRFAMAIDPAPSDIFDLKSFSSIAIPVQLVNLGRPDNIPLTAQASGIAKTIPDAGYRLVEDASHFSMFAPCKPGANDIIASQEIGDPVCTDGGGRSRPEIHAQLIDMTAEAFSRALTAAP